MYQTAEVEKEAGSQGEATLKKENNENGNDDVLSVSGSDDASSGSQSDSEGGVPLETPAPEVKQTKKRRRESNAASNGDDAKETSKAKKTKAQSSEESPASDEDSDAESSSDASDSSDSEEVEKKEEQVKTEKKDKKKKNKTKQEGPDSGEQWNVGGLEGGEARQSKFMRLLGGKKGGAAPKAAAKVKADSVKAEAEIQRQFEAGMKAKAEGGERRKGLGA